MLIYVVIKRGISQLIIPTTILGLIILIQIILGILTVLSGAGIILASLHQLSSIFLMSSTLFFLYKNRFS